MKAVRQRDTRPELMLRRWLHRAGLRFRVCAEDLPGRPDIANKTRKWCIFVHGCFWHGHRNCKLARLPKTNREWWLDKITANRKRDTKKRAALVRMGYRVETVWQCELSNESQINGRLRWLSRVVGRRPRRSENRD